MLPDKIALIQKFYTAFQARDYTSMQDCYHSEATFYDPVFKELTSDEVKIMWKMLCERGKDLVLSFSDIEEEKGAVSCRWEAQYIFGKTGRKVDNKIFASFTFKDGKIYTHRDDFDFWKWSRMALGTSGLFLGWTSFLHEKVSFNARRSLKNYA